MPRILAAVVCVVVFALAGFSQSNKITGVWKLVEVKTTGDNAETNSSPQPSQYIFTKKHYSVIFVSSKVPRPEPADLAALTADELRDIFVNSFVANAGTYEVSGNKVTLRPAIAKAPNFMKAGNFSVSTFKIEGQYLTMVAESNNSGPVRNPTTVKLIRVE